MGRQPLQSFFSQPLQLKIHERARALQADPKLWMDFTIGDVRLPLPPVVTDALHRAVQELSDESTFKGYGPAVGYRWLREQIGSVLYGNEIGAEEIILGDGLRSTFHRLLSTFNPPLRLAIFTPCYPAFLDIAQQLLPPDHLYLVPYDSTNQRVGSWPEEVDALVLVNPNNPTGTLLPLEILQKVVETVHRRGQLLLLDSAYQSFIQDRAYPLSVYHLAHARECTIDMGSASKSASMASLRLSWHVIPKEILARFKALQNYGYAHSTLFQGPSYLAQVAAYAAFSKEGREQLKTHHQSYLKQAKRMLEGFTARGWEASGGVNCPFLWVKPPGRIWDSWELFDHLLLAKNWLTVPGTCFGPGGEGYVRLSGFSRVESVDKLLTSLEKE